MRGFWYLIALGNAGLYHQPYETPFKQNALHQGLSRTKASADCAKLGFFLGCKGLGLRGLGFRGLAFRVWGLGFRVSGFGFRGLGFAKAGVSEAFFGGAVERVVFSVFILGGGVYFLQSQTSRSGARSVWGCWALGLGFTGLHLGFRGLGLRFRGSGL